MKKRLKKRVILCVIGLFVLISSCVEDGENVDYYLINNTENDLSIVRTDPHENLDTIILSQGEKITFNEYEDSGNTARCPFCNFKTLTFINVDSYKVTYQYSLDSLKNPFNIDSYTETSRKIENHITYIEFAYYITEDDFEK